MVAPTPHTHGAQELLQKTIDADAAGIYTVTKLEEGCESSVSTVITKSTAVEIADVEGCEDDAPISIDATIPDGSSYAWTGGASTGTAINNFTASGSYSVTATDTMVVSLLQILIY